MLAARARKAKKTLSFAPNVKAGDDSDENKKPKLDDFIKSRDYSGAVTLLEFQRQTNSGDEKTLPWLAYAAFHLGDYKKAMSVYQELLQKPHADVSLHLYVACCMFYLGMYKEAEAEALKGPSTRLQNRLLFHLAHKMGDETKLMKFHQQIKDTVEDQLSLASIHYLRSHFQEATDIYKRLLLEKRENMALQVYIAMCYYKLDYFDVSLEILAPYLEKHPQSAVAINLKACNQYKLSDGSAAEDILKPMVDAMVSSSQNVEYDIVRHNLVIFNGGENALQVLPPLVDVLPEARLNLVITHLRNNDVAEAFALIENLEPTTPQEYVLKGVVNAAMGQLKNSREHLKQAQQYFHLVGASASECDTIPGRQCMASCFFLLKKFEEVLIYLNSIKAYCSNDSSFSYNYGVSLAACGQFREAQEALLQVQDEKILSDYTYLSWLCRCFIMTGAPHEAWDIYLKMDSNQDSFTLLILIANDCYRVGAFYYAAKAFDVLDRLEATADYWEGKRGACCGVFQMVIAGRAKKELLRDVIGMLKTGANTPQAELIIRVMSNWAVENGIKC